MHTSLYGDVWRASARQRLRLAVLTVALFPRFLAPLELQRLPRRPHPDRPGPVR